MISLSVYIASYLSTLLEEIARGGALSQEQIDALAISLPFGTLALLIGLAGAAFLFLFRFGWLLAIVSQGLTLLLTLILYRQMEPWLVYPVMIYSALMVFYLHASGVQATFSAGSR